MKQGDIIQVAHVVRDIDQVMQRYWDEFGIGPFDVYTFAPPDVRDSKVRGRPSDHTYLVAQTWLNEVQLELIQPLTGRSIYDEHLEKRGEAVHHVKLYYPKCADALREFARRGIGVIQCGKFDQDEFYYLDTEQLFGYIIEIGNNGKLRPAQRRFPA